jgi:N-acetylneuraminic acid mutarotase
MLLIAATLLQGRLDAAERVFAEVLSSPTVTNRPLPSVAPKPADGPRAGVWEKRQNFLRGRIYHSAIWTYAEMIVWGGGSEHQFYNDGGIYDPVKDQWRSVSEANAPSGRWAHAAVWTGNEMIVWGGRGSFAPSHNKNDGGLYNPTTDTWRPMNTAGAPAPRSQMAAVWTGEELIVWGGWADGGDCLATGASYNPRTDTWTPLPLENAPEARMEPAFVWTGRELVIWGGLLQGGIRSSGTGARYDPDRKIWKPLPAEGAPVSSRGMHAVWTGTEMIVWGGAHLEGESPINIGLNTGGRYNPTTDSWQPTAVNTAPEGRLYYASAWTGDEMIVWSGGDQKRGNTSTGARYNPISNEWIATANNGAPAARGICTAVWTGEGMLIYGGSTGGVEAFNETYYYRPEASRVEGDPDTN